MKAKVAIRETYELPSNGVLYKDEGIPSTITLRAMNALDEKIRLASSGMRTIPELLKSCIVNDEKIDPYKLKLFDLQFLMYKLRIITYGSEYKVRVNCPHCGQEHEIIVNLDEIPINKLDSNFVEPFEIGSLPVSGDSITCRLLSAEDFINMETEARKIKAKFPNYIGDPEFILNYKYKIVSINGECKPQLLQSYIENMHAKDMRYFDSKYNEVADNLGMDLNMTDICPSCGGDIDYTIPVTTEFFRPKY